MNKQIKKYGHPKFYELLEQEADLHSCKNYDYATGGNPLGNFYRVAQILALYPNLKLSEPSVYAIVQLLKQLDAALWMQSNGHKAMVEGIDKRWQDVAVYAKLIQILLTEKLTEKQELDDAQRWMDTNGPEEDWDTKIGTIKAIKKMIKKARR